MGFWSKAGDVIGEVTSAPLHLAQKAAAEVDSAVPSLGAIDEAASVAGKGVARGASAAAQFGYEAVVGTGREIAAGRVKVDNMGLIHTKVKPGASVLDQTTVGQAFNEYRKSGRVDLGTGLVPGGRVVKDQAKAAGDAYSVDGHAATPGRMLAHGLASVELIQPGTVPYRVVSGLTDAAATWFGDPTVRAIGAASEARKASSALAAGATAEDVAKAAAKAPEDYRLAMHEAAGLVTGGNRPGVVPAQFDQFLYSSDGQKLVDRMAKETSATEIWRAANEQIPIAVAQQLADSGDPATVIATLRQHVGSEVMPSSLVGYDSLKTRLISSTQDNIRAAGIKPNTWLPFDRPEVFIKNLDDSLNNANVMGETRRAILDRAFRAITSDSPTARKEVIDIASDAVKESLIGHGVDPETAKAITSYKSQLDRIPHFFVEGDTGRDINFTHAIDGEGHAIEGAKPVATVDLMHNGVQLYDPSQVQEVRRLTSAFRPFVDAGMVRWPHSIVAWATNTLWKGAEVLRPAMIERVLGESTAAAMASGKFDSAADWLNFAAMHRGEVAPGGKWFDLNKEADALTQKLVDGGLSKAEEKAAQARLGQLNEEVRGAKTEYDQIRTMRAYRDLEFVKAEKNMVMADNWPIVNKVSDPFRWKQGVADRIAALSQDPVYRRVADGGLAEGDRAASSVERVARPLAQLPDDAHYLRPLKDYTDSVFRETSLDNLSRLFGTSGNQAGDAFWATSRDLAKGQGKNAGQALVEMDTTGVKGFLSKAKPNWKFAYQNGEAELITQHLDGRAAFDNVRRIEVDASQADSPRWKSFFGQFTDRGFKRVDVGDGRIAFVHPTATTQLAPARPGLDGIVDWLNTGTGSKFRKMMEGVYPSMTSEQVSQAMVSTAEKQLQSLVGDQADLRQILVNGKINGVAAFTKTKDGLVPTDEMLARLKDWAEHPESPSLARYHQTQATKMPVRPDVATMRSGAEWVQQTFFGQLMARPSDYLHRSPTFKAASWGHMEDLMPYLAPDAQATVLKNAKAAGLGEERLTRLADRAAQGSGSATVEAAEKLANGHAADDMAKLFHGGRQASQFFDITRAIFPFGDVWFNMLRRWSGILAENPQTIRRGQMVFNAGRGADLNGDGQGFFHKDPTTGDEVFSFPLPGPVADALGVQYKASIKGLTFGTEVHPGIGPVGVLGLSEIMKHVPLPDDVTKFLLPFGTNSDVGNMLPPAWTKMFEGAVRHGDIYANSFSETYRQLAASGKYDLSNANDLQRLEGDAKQRAQAVTLLRGVMQMFAPSAPQVDYKAKTFKGDRVAGALVKDFAQMRADQDAGKIPSAVAAFTYKYGPNAFTYISGKTRSQVGGQEASAGYGRWEQQNKGLISKYPSIAGYFGPQGEGFSNTVFQRQEQQGNRDRQKPQEALAQAESILAGWIWSTKKDAIGAHPTPDQSAWLVDFKDKLVKQYPGWNPDQMSGRLPQQVRELDRARVDPKVAETPIGQALNIYFAKRQEAFDVAKSSYGLRSGDGPLQADRGRPLRDWLRGIGAELAKQTPQFSRIWEDVLSHEMHDDAAGPGSAG